MSERTPISLKDQAVRAVVLVGAALGMSACGSSSIQPCDQKTLPGNLNLLLTQMEDINNNSTNDPSQAWRIHTATVEDWLWIRRDCDSVQEGGKITRYTQAISAWPFNYLQEVKPSATDLTLCEAVGPVCVASLHGGFVVSSPNHAITIHSDGKIDIH